MKTIRQTQPSNEIREIKLSLVDFIYLQSFLCHPNHSSMVRNAKDLQTSIISCFTHNTHLFGNIYYASRTIFHGYQVLHRNFNNSRTDAKNTVESLSATTSQHSWQHSLILGKMMEKANKFARGHQLKR